VKVDTYHHLSYNEDGVSKAPTVVGWFKMKSILNQDHG